jgi:hypothetical protein
VRIFTKMSELELTFIPSILLAGYLRSLLSTNKLFSFPRYPSSHRSRVFRPHPKYCGSIGMFGSRALYSLSDLGRSSRHLTLL